MPRTARLQKAKGSHLLTRRKGQEQLCKFLARKGVEMKDRAWQTVAGQDEQANIAFSLKTRPDLLQGRTVDRVVLFAIFTGHLGFTGRSDELVEFIGPQGAQQAEGLLLAAGAGKRQESRPEHLVRKILQEKRSDGLGREPLAQQSGRRW